MDLEEELRNKIKEAREEAAVEQEPKDNDVPVEEAESKEEVKQEVVEVVEDPEEQVAEDGTEEELSDIQPDTEEYEKLDSKGKKFAHMRKEAKEKDQKLQAMAERLARLEGAQSVQQEKLTPAEEKEEVPDKEFQPEAWMDYQLKKQDDKYNNLAKRFDENAQQTAQQKDEILYKNLERDYSDTDSSYMEARSYYKAKNAEKYREQYPAASTADIDLMVKTEEYKLVQGMSASGVSTDLIFNTLKGQALAMGFKDVPVVKQDKTKLKKNIRKSASLNDAPSAGEDLGFSESQMSRMKSADFHKLASNPKEMKKAKAALMAARIRAFA